MKKQYTTPVIICVALDASDIIATSLSGDKTIQVANDDEQIDKDSPIWGNIN